MLEEQLFEPVLLHVGDVMTAERLMFPDDGPVGAVKLHVSRVDALGGNENVPDADGPDCRVRLEKDNVYVPAIVLTESTGPLLLLSMLKVTVTVPPLGMLLMVFPDGITCVTSTLSPSVNVVCARDFESRASR